MDRLSRFLLPLAALLLFIQPLTAQPQSSVQSVAAPSSAENVRLWPPFGDPYPDKPRAHEGISNFLLLEGPGNANPGNIMNLPQDNPGLRIPMELKKYIARQFRYVVFDMESFAERTSRNGPATKLMTPAYHEEAEALMKLNPDMIVFPYFCFTLVREASPHWDTVQQHESWILHRKGAPLDPESRVRAEANGFYMMDPNNPEWRKFYITYITGIVRKYHYRGVMLDNMTPFPFISPADTGSVKPSIHREWFGYVQTFLKQLKAELPKSVKVICNSLSLDPPDAKRPFWGVSGGAAVAQYADGAMSEAFHITGWTENLRRELAVMKKMASIDKLFLVVAHYARGEDKNLADLFALKPSAWVGDPAPPQETFQEMQMSYLARFLLGIPQKHSERFAFSFVPGTMLYQYIPYYAIWDEDFGTPVTKSFVTDGPILKREFSHCIVYVNDSESSSTVTLPAKSKWFTYDTWRRLSKSGTNEQTGVETVALQRHQGIILFKSKL